MTTRKTKKVKRAAKKVDVGAEIRKIAEALLSRPVPDILVAQRNRAVCTVAKLADRMNSEAGKAEKTAEREAKKAEREKAKAVREAAKADAKKAKAAKLTERIAKLQAEVSKLG